jgi:uncharacterized membrane protein
MSNPIRSLGVLLCSLMLATTASTPTSAAVHTTAVGKASQSRAGFGRSYRAPSSRSRYRARPPHARRYRRPSFGHGLFGGILRALGIAYLFHALFGWGGGGGSPLGLLLLAAIVLFLASRRRRVAYH